jgi:tetratricopeptide (TPR) repeat protein
MTGILLIAAVAVWLLFYRPSVDGTGDLPVKISEKLDQLWGIAQESLRENKYLRAEKALLTILRVDQKNATAYNRLGILYAKQRAYKDAIECFEIAQSIEPSASSLHNVGLIYFETGDYDKAALAFEQAIELEDDLAARYIAYAKTQEKLDNSKKMIHALEKAVELEPIPQTLTVLAEAYEKIGQLELAASLREKAARMLVPPSTPAAPKTGRVQRTPKQPRKIIM